MLEVPRNVMLWIAATVIALVGCSKSQPLPNEIQIGDSIESARLSLEHWGGEGTYLSRYTVTVPADAKLTDDQNGGEFHIDTPVSDYSASSQSPDIYRVVDPTTFPFDGYTFGSRTIVLHGKTTISDIEILVSDGGGKSTEVSTYGHKRVAKANLVQ